MFAGYDAVTGLDLKREKSVHVTSGKEEPVA